MVRIKQIRFPLLTMVMAAVFSMPAHGQYYGQEPERWKVNGFAGFDLTHTTQGQVNQDRDFSQLFPLGDLRLNSTGFLLDPKFLNITTGFEYQKGANTSERGDLGTGGVNLAVGTAFLPKSYYPLRVSYTRSDHGITGLGADQNTDDNRLDVHWDVLLPHIPHVTLTFQDYSSTVHIPSSFADTSFDNMGGGLSLSDSWKNWRWVGNYAVQSGNSVGASSLTSNLSFDDLSKVGSFNLYRDFWDNKARLRFDNREVWRNDHLGGDGITNSDEFTDNVNLDVQLTPKLGLSTGYGFSQIDFASSGSSANTLLPGSALQVLSLVANTSHTISGRANYRILDWLRFTQDVRTTLSTPTATIAESETAFTESASTIAASHRWRGFDLAGSYTGRYQISDTTLDNTPSAWSNGFDGRIGWGNVKNVRLTGTAQSSRLSLVEQIGGFSDQKRFSAEAETARLKFFLLRAGAEYANVDLLNVSGKVGSKIKTYSIQAENRMATLAFSTSFSDGAGAIFPLGAIDRQFLVIPLPISLLLNTPLLNRSSRANTVTFIARPRRRMDVSVAWRLEDTELATSDQSFNILQANARYHLGKFTLEGGYSRNSNDVTFITGLSGTRLAIWYLRIGRDFKVF
jgi:hypothetical protein